MPQYSIHLAERVAGPVLRGQAGVHATAGLQEGSASVAQAEVLVAVHLFQGGGEVMKERGTSEAKRGKGMKE